MLLFGFPFPKTSTPPSRSAESDAAFQVSGAPTAVDTLAPTPCTERHHHDNEVDGLGHYIDSRLCDERFRID